MSLEVYLIMSYIDEYDLLAQWESTTLTGKLSFILRAISSVGEYVLDRDGVGGSNPSSLIGLSHFLMFKKVAFLCSN